MSLKVAYLFSRYSADSFLCIAREIACLKRCGCEVQIFSVESGQKKTECLAAFEAEACTSIFYLDESPSRARIAKWVAVMGGFPMRLRELLKSGMLDRLDIKKFFRWVSSYSEKGTTLAKQLQLFGASHMHIYGDETALRVGSIARQRFPINFSFTIGEASENGGVPDKFLREKIADASLVRCVNAVIRSQLMTAAHFSDLEKLRLIPDGVDFSIFRPHAFRYNPSPFEIVSVGPLTSSAGQRILLQASENLVRRGRNIKLRLVGDGPDRAELERYVAEKRLVGNVAFESETSQERLRDMYASADLFALASLAEAVPTTLMRAMAMEIPCVATYVAGAAEIIRNGVDGILTPLADAEALAEAIARLMDDSELRREVGKSGRLRIAESYNWAKQDARLEDMFCQCLGGMRVQKTFSPESAPTSKVWHDWTDDI